MGKLLKTFIILNLALSIVVAIFGFQLFRDREIVKARTILLETNAQRVAANLSWGQEVDWESSEDRRSGTFTVPQPASPGELASMENTLGELGRFATQRLAQLNQRHNELVQTRRQADEARETLATRERELASTRQELATAQERVSSMETDLRQSRLEVNTIRVEREGLERQVQQLNTQVSERDDQIASLEVDIARLREDLSNLTQRTQARTPGGAGTEAWVGRPATILAVNETYQFVILDKGSIDVLPVGIEAIIHRGDEFIGTVTVRQVEELVAIAEINPATLTPGERIQPNDTVFF
ncbi:MAG: hypothetical protein JJU05_15830 [Verrucomicrobia bacterium]|nr:hypothetical protein [Verrucomicrobiota bacterium]MCH8528228.1 hypothetical protein [Kiritimatiellia bacterium]